MTFVAPKDVKENVFWREQILLRSARDIGFQTQLWVACKRNFSFWVDLFTYTISPKDNPKHPRIPFILYEFQEKAAASLIDALGKEDRLVEKSRDMGATWLILLIFVWRFLFYEDQSFLVGSRKQEFVDKIGDPKTLFSKIDFILDNLPRWMKPKVVRKMNHIENPRLNCVIDGESTNENFGAGDRRVAVLLDEFALCDFGHKILAAVGDVTNCCIYNSTPMGASGAYFDTREKMANETPHRIIRLHWSDHPLKRRGLYTSVDSQLKILDTNYKFPKNYKFILDNTLRSVAYDARELRSPNRQIMASQWNIDYVKSGTQFFDGIKLAALIGDKTIVRPPLVTGDLIRDTDGSLSFIETAAGKLQLWFKIPLDGKIPWNDIVIGCDVASGTGGDDSSNSSASIVRRNTGEKIGELTSPLISPTDFAKYCLNLCEWMNRPLLIWERNGPNGAMFGKVIKDANYTNLYYQRKEARFDFVRYKEPGWYTSDESKPILLGTYAEALWTGAFINHSEAALLECGHYVQNGRKIEHSRSLAGATTDPTAIGEAHGDRCFVAGTMIMTEHGERPIETIEVGDRVLTRLGLHPVIAAGKTSDSAPVSEVVFDSGRTLIGTPNHPIYADGDWRPLGSLIPGESVAKRYSLEKHLRTVGTKVILSTPLLPLAVYNLSVDKCHEYFANGILVHNCIADAIAYRGVKERAEEAAIAAESKRNDIPVNSAAYRRLQWEREQREALEYVW